MKTFFDTTIWPSHFDVLDGTPTGFIVFEGIALLRLFLRSCRSPWTTKCAHKEIASICNFNNAITLINCVGKKDFQVDSTFKSKLAKFSFFDFTDQKSKAHEYTVV